MSDLLKAANQASKAPLTGRTSTPPKVRPKPAPKKKPVAKVKEPQTQTWGSKHERKTLHIRSDLLQETRREARKQEISVSAYINQALEKALAEP